MYRARIKLDNYQNQFNDAMNRSNEIAQIKHLHSYGFGFDEIVEITGALKQTVRYYTR